MRTILLAATMAAALAAQPVTITPSGPATASAGSSVTLTVSATGTTGLNVAGVQFKPVLPAGFTLGAPVITPALGTAGMTTACGPNGCVVVDFSAIFGLPADGAVVTIPITIASTVAAGNQSITLSGPLAVDIGGLNIAAVAGTAYAIKILSPCDVNGDGTITVADVLAVIQGTLGTGSCPIAAANGGCTLTSVMDEVIAATGGACKIP